MVALGGDDEARGFVAEPAGPKSDCGKVPGAIGAVGERIGVKEQSSDKGSQSLSLFVTLRSEGEANLGILDRSMRLGAVKGAVRQKWGVGGRGPPARPACGERLDTEVAAHVTSAFGLPRSPTSSADCCRPHQPSPRQRASVNNGYLMLLPAPQLLLPHPTTSSPLSPPSSVLLLLHTLHTLHTLLPLCSRTRTITFEINTSDSIDYTIV